ncbi:phage holin family protein [Teichococcus vastitatis]|uniref:Phage holin family protein n=1 Tax=Teichococcus vastitatis TaxID=2307076 RepID=A0ABS9W5E7_9PROT|nr:phage holin family protein [Pseudoroseomonas vastitatis]MCI0754522.1 phage holin family protein [Pseudoroseomonas vastitatis]
MGFLLRTLITAVAFWIAEYLIDGISFSGPVVTIIAAIVFGIVNALIRPVLMLLTLPVNLVTLGLFTLVVNAAMLGLTALVMPGMRVDGFWAAFIGAIIVALVSWAASKLIADREVAANR